jgi:hypothetical protein
MRDVLLPRFVRRFGDNHGDQFVRRSEPAHRPSKLSGSSAAPKCSNQTDLRLTLADLFYGPDLPERPSPTSMRLVCIQMLSIVRPRPEQRSAAELSRILIKAPSLRGAAGPASAPRTRAQAGACPDRARASPL